MIAGIKALKEEPAYFIELFWGEKRDILNLLSYLVQTRNANTWLYAMCEVLEPKKSAKRKQSLRNDCRSFVPGFTAQS